MAYLHKEYVKNKRKSYMQYLKHNLEGLDDFLLKTKRLGASMYGIDVTEYDGVSSTPMCLYAFKINKQKNNSKNLVGAISKSGEKIVEDYRSIFSSKSRKFLYLDVTS